MKKKLVLASLLASAVVPVAVVAADTNVNSLNATLITGEQQVQTALDSEGVERWYKVYVEKNDALLFHVLDGPDLRYNVTIYNGEGTGPSTKSVYSNTYNSGKSFNAYKVPESGYYYVKLNAYNKKEIAANPFTIRITNNKPDSFEYNDTSLTAVQLKEQSGQFKLNLNAPNDLDYFKVALTDKQSISLQFTNMPTDLRYNVEFYNEKDGLINQVELRETYINKNKVVTFKAPRTGNYYALVKPYNKDHYSADLFTMNYSILEGDAFENNDDSVLAKPLIVDEVSTVTLQAGNDKDWFYTDVKSGEAIVVTTQINDPTFRYMFRIYNEKGGIVDTRVFNETYIQGGKTFSYKPALPGRYYISVEPHNQEYFSTEPLTLKLALNPGDENEPNDDSMQAVDLITSRIFTLSAGNDVDWFKVKVNPGENLSFLINNLPTEVRHTVQVYNELNGKTNNRIINETYLNKTNFEINKEVEPGNYYIAVKPHSTDSGFSLSPITITNRNSKLEVPAQSLTLSQTAGTVAVGYALQLYAYVSPADATDNEITWTSSDSSVASVSGTGLVSARKDGVAIITATTKSGKVTASATITVGDAKPIEPTPEPTPPVVGEEYKIWTPQVNVDKNKSWKITFALPFDPETILSDNIYIEDSKGNIVAQSFIYSGSETESTLQIKPTASYTPGETYTLVIKNVLGKNGEVLKQFAKMNFTIKLDKNEITEIQ